MTNNIIGKELAYEFLTTDNEELSKIDEYLKQLV